MNALARSCPPGELGELFAHIDLKILDLGPAQHLPNLQTLLRALAIDGALDLKQRTDPTHHLDRDRRESVNSL